ncbi:O6-methylguanine-DNA methyltransferase [Acetobacter orientalis]|uniref:O6-methylguanine-DNA methyltransferase n=1 Tax=Acetobacter orientalis TaxID=146474 RepID=A0A2Z5ZK10_9PROT|nr:O6-methylguanine-DNA methyltransferase [Acetobacter orientalis]
MSPLFTHKAFASVWGMVKPRLPAYYGKKQLLTPHTGAHTPCPSFLFTPH